MITSRTCLIVAGNFKSSLYIYKMAELALDSVTSENFIEW